MSRLSLTLLLCAAVACSRPPSILSTTDQESLIHGLCTAVAADDVAAAGTPFFDQAHGPLHLLADQMRASDLAGDAADLLIAKQRVEASFQQGLPHSFLRANLVTLEAATDRGLARLGLPPLDCEGR